MAVESRQKLSSRLAGVDLSNVGKPHAERPAGSRPPPRTAIGMHAQQLYADLSLQVDNTRLKAELEAFAGALPSRLLNPNVIRHSPWANRHPLSFSTDEFNELKSEIALAGGNIQPIKVRPIASVDGTDQFEIVFGHRRHRACLDLGLPVLALIEEVSNLDLFAQMYRENFGRENLRPYEQGVMYAKALDSGLYPSLRKLAVELTLDHSSVSKLIAIARLPSSVIEAFASPLDIQFSWGYRLSRIVEAKPDAVIACAAQIASSRASGQRLSASAVFDLLLMSAEGSAANVAQPTIITGVNGSRAEVVFTGRSAKITFKNIPSEKRLELEQMVSRFLSGD